MLQESEPLPPDPPPTAAPTGAFTRSRSRLSAAAAHPAPAQRTPRAAPRLGAARAACLDCLFVSLTALVVFVPRAGCSKRPPTSCGARRTRHARGTEGRARHEGLVGVVAARGRRQRHHLASCFVPRASCVWACGLCLDAGIRLSLDQCRARNRIAIGPGLIGICTFATATTETAHICESLVGAGRERVLMLLSKKTGAAPPPRCALYAAEYAKLTHLANS